MNIATRRSRGFDVCGSGIIGVVSGRKAGKVLSTMQK